MDLVSNTAIDSQLFSWRALGFGRVFKTPAKQPKSKGKDRTRLFCLITHANGKRETFLKGGRDIRDLLLRNVYADFFHSVDRKRAHRCRLNGCANRGQLVTGKLAQETFRHFASLGSTGAEE